MLLGYFVVGKSLVANSKAAESKNSVINKAGRQIDIKLHNF